jgi:transcriptional regulator with XRE-family HTH domain
VFDVPERAAMTFREKLRELREAVGLSEAKLAKACGIPPGTLHNYCIGVRRPSLAAAAKIARALGTTCDVFAECSDIAGRAAPKPRPKRRES